MRTRIMFGLASALGTLVACTDPDGGQGPAPEVHQVVGVVVAPDEPPPLAELAFTPPHVYGPARLVDLDPNPDVVEVELVAAPVTSTVAGRQLTMYAFDGQLPGPLLQAKVGDTVVVHFYNQLPEPTTIHWHGVRVPEDMDGSPRIQSPVQPGESFDYVFVVPDAGTFWYHPHVRTNEQVEKGLYGPIIVHDEHDPKFDAERYLMLDDIYISRGRIAPFLANHMEAMHGRNGNVLLTNGVAEAVVDTSERGRVERWHLVNAANARLMSLDLPGASWQIVGVDGGRVEPYTRDRLELAPGQRYDLEVRYEEEGSAKLQSWVLVQDAQGNVVEEPRTVFQVDVAASDREPTAVEWPAVPERELRTVSSTVTLTFDAVSGGEFGIEWRLNHQIMPMDPLFTFDRGATVRMRLVNQLGPYHPFHLHGQFFEVVYDGRPETDMPGLRDTVVLPGLETIEIIAYFDNPGHWMAHCHILEHAELGMMGEIVVNP